MEALNDTGMDVYNIENFNMDNGNLTQCPLMNITDEVDMWEKVLVGSILGLMICLTLLGNSLVVIAVISFERLRSVANMFIVSLAIADITVALLVMPVSLVTEVQPDFEISWIFCYFYMSCDVMCCTASILHLCVISLDRYLAITAPFRYHKRLPMKRAAIIIAAVWICSIAISFAPIFLGWFSDVDVMNNTNCPQQWSIKQCGLNNITEVYAVVSSATSFYVPLTVMIIVYVNILKIAKGQVLEINKLYVSVSVNDSPGGGRRDRVRRRSRQISKDVKAIRTLGILMGVFIVCWLPFFIMYVLMAFCKSCYLPSRAVTGITWLGYANSVFNPCVYAFMNQDFRNAFYKLLSCSTSGQSQLKLCFKPQPATNVVERIQL